MADFVLSAPGSTNSPWAPANVIVLHNTIKSDATGWRGSTAGVASTFAHNVNYGSVITTSVTLATTGSNGDDVYVGSAVRSGANNGALVGAYVGLSSCFLGYVDTAGAQTNISGSVSITRAAADVWTVITTNIGGTIGIVLKQNSTTIVGFGSSSTTQYGNEASLAAGAQFAPNNSNTLYLSQFTGTGVLVAVTPAFPSQLYINP